MLYSTVQLERYVEHSHRVECCAGDLKVRESALQALGCLGIARPSTLLAAEAQSVMKSALQPSAPTILKTRALTNLTELLKVHALPVQLLMDVSPSDLVTPSHSKHIMRLSSTC